jgi:GT2 family glycosyltransferase
LPLKISIVDNASDPSLLQTLRNHLPQNVELIELKENKGWGGGLNVLLRDWLSREDSTYCFVSAHDAIPNKKCLNMLLSSAYEDSKIGIACPEYGIDHLPKFSPLRGPYLAPVSHRPEGTAETIIFPHGTLMLLRKQCLREIGLFDERYFAYGDEYDLGLRAKQYQWKVVVVWGAIVDNPGSWTSEPVKTYLFARNSLLLALKHAGSGWALLRALLMIPNTLRLLCQKAEDKRSFLSARIFALRDFLLNHYGSPPMSLSK